MYASAIRASVFGVLHSEGRVQVPRFRLIGKKALLESTDVSKKLELGSNWCSVSIFQVGSRTFNI
ncbi:hypothetical protein HanXRQr2_Chr02g0047191 [Helianthus annuus]|uniref:Uncharacterized protein n=1 Tax=Helianthus annuus TaxID=4232 RepID=A0A251SG88_HELAN|nr:hypothetical protein HanXRQr2_Chr02g0047191 [Helianthus annuus]KAJ0950306.1 hypothetical protein HanPSC8_Chr02g0046741 [Helianthus annuus]